MFGSAVADVASFPDAGFSTAEEVEDAVGAAAADGAAPALERRRRRQLAHVERRLLRVGVGTQLEHRLIRPQFLMGRVKRAVNTSEENYVQEQRTRLDQSEQLPSSAYNGREFNRPDSTYTHTQHTRQCDSIQADRQTDRQTDTHTHTHTTHNTRTYVHTPTHARTCTLSLSHAHTRARTHTRAHTHDRAHARTHLVFLSLPLEDGLVVSVASGAADHDRLARVTANTNTRKIKTDAHARTHEYTHPLTRVTANTNA